MIFMPWVRDGGAVGFFARKAGSAGSASMKGAADHFFADYLGSGRVMTDAVGNVEQEWDYYPFGGERVITDTLNDPYTAGGESV
jgi:uncharacterized protein RhaS with RHS repeats